MVLRSATVLLAQLMQLSCSITDLLTYGLMTSPGTATYKPQRAKYFDKNSYPKRNDVAINSIVEILHVQLLKGANIVAIVSIDKANLPLANRWSW